MGLYLADTIKTLPSTELRRLQKSLRLIYNPRSSADSLRNSILRAYHDLGCPLERIRSVGLDEVFEKLLCSFGTLDALSLSDEDRQKLQQLPYTFWPDESHCFVSAEILDLLAENPAFKKENFLFNTIRRLSARERMAWVHWIELDPEGRSGRDLVAHLYAHLAGLQQAAPKAEYSLAINKESLPAYLDEVWPDNPLENQVAWYYRGVLPFYQCLAQEEQQLIKARQTKSHQFAILQLLKAGQLYIAAEAEEYGQPTRYLLRPTQESQPTRRYAVYQNQASNAEQRTTEKQGMLF